MATYDMGDQVRCTGTFRNAAGTLTDPTLVKFDWRIEQTGTVTTYTGIGTIVKDSTGIYHVDIDADVEGNYFYRFYSTGTGKAAAESKFFVESNF